MATLNLERNNFFFQVALTRDASSSQCPQNFVAQVKFVLKGPTFPRASFGRHFQRISNFDRADDSAKEHLKNL